MAFTYSNNSKIHRKFDFEERKINGFCSIDVDKQYSESFLELKYVSNLVNEEIEFDLNQDNIKEEEIEYLNEYDSLIITLKWITNNFNKVHNAVKPKYKCLIPDFICARETLLKLCLTPYAKKPWRLFAAKFQGNIYLYINEDEQNRNNINSDDKIKDLILKKFLLADSPSGNPLETIKPETINGYQSFNCIFNTFLENNALLYSGKVDGVDSENYANGIDINSINFTQINTIDEKQYNTKPISLPYQLLQFWIKAYLSRAENIILALESNNKVKKLVNQKTEDVPKDNNVFWNKDKCFDFCNRFLCYIKNTVTSEMTDKIYKFEFNPMQKNENLRNDIMEIHMEQILINNKLYENYLFLPAWYIKEVCEKNPSFDNTNSSSDIGSEAPFYYVFNVSDADSQKTDLFKVNGVIGCYSINSNREYSSDEYSSLRYLSRAAIKNADFDLNEGIDDVIRKPPNPETDKMNYILRWIINNYQQVKTSGENIKQCLKSDFVCMRGVLIKLCLTPYDRDGWTIRAIKFRGNIYLYAEENEKNANFINSSPKFQKMASWGLKFHQFLLSDSPNNLPDTSTPVNEGNEFCCVFNTQFEKHSLIYAAEVNGLVAADVLKKPINFNEANIIKLATMNRRQYNSNHSLTFALKQLKWWLQCTLIGSENIICGLRTVDGKIDKLEHIKVGNIPKDNEDYWQDDKCIHFCYTFLNFIKLRVLSEYEDCIYKFTYNPKDKTSDGIKCQVSKIYHNDKTYSDSLFLPDWYINFIKKQSIENNIEVETEDDCMNLGELVNCENKRKNNANQELYEKRRKSD